MTALWLCGGKGLTTEEQDRYSTEKYQFRLSIPKEVR
jgi:hypothetical protein